MMPDFLHGECKHEPFDYRPYRRGVYRCHVCGGHLPLSAVGKIWVDAILETIMKPNPLIDILRGRPNPQKKCFEVWAG